MKHDYTLSDEFRKNHFLAGLLLHEVKMSLSENRDIRKPAVTTLRNLLAKHAFDERYSTKVRFLLHMISGTPLPIDDICDIVGS